MFQLDLIENIMIKVVELNIRPLKLMMKFSRLKKENYSNFSNLDRSRLLDCIHLTLHLLLFSLKLLPKKNSKNEHG